MKPTMSMHASRRDYQAALDDWFRVEITDSQGQVVAIEKESLAGRDIGAKECKVICKCIKHLNGFLGAGYVDLTCSADPRNPCWDGRPTDVVGQHWSGLGKACNKCNARAALAA